MYSAKAYTRPRGLAKMRQRRWFRQLVISLSLLLMIYGLFQMNHPLASRVQHQLKYYLASEQADWTPVIAQAVQAGIWMDTYNRRVFEMADIDTTFVQETITSPVSGSVLSPFGWLESPVDREPLFNPGVLLEADSASEVRASLEGKVAHITEEPAGTTIRIIHTRERETFYGNIETAVVEVDQQVQSGQVIGYTGDTGWIIFKIKKEGEFIDPASYLPQLTDAE